MMESMGRKLTSGELNALRFDLVQRVVRAGSGRVEFHLEGSDHDHDQQCHAGGCGSLGKSTGKPLKKRGRKTSPEQLESLRNVDEVVWMLNEAGMSSKEIQEITGLGRHEIPHSLQRDYIDGVYLIQVAGTNEYKIGQSVRGIRERLKNIQESATGEVKLLAFIPVKQSRDPKQQQQDLKDLEKKLQDQFVSSNIERNNKPSEWYRFDDNGEEILSLIENLPKDIKKHTRDFRSEEADIVAEYITSDKGLYPSSANKGKKNRTKVTGVFDDKKYAAIQELKKTSRVRDSDPHNPSNGVYLVQVGDSNIFKIGHAVDGVVRRINSLEAQGANELTLRGWIPANDPGKIEGAIHSLLSETGAHVWGEHYVVDDKRVFDLFTRPPQAIADPDKKFGAPYATFEVKGIRGTPTFGTTYRIVRTQAGVEKFGQSIGSIIKVDDDDLSTPT